VPFPDRFVPEDLPQTRGFVCPFPRYTLFISNGSEIGIELPSSSFVVSTLALDSGRTRENFGPEALFFTQIWPLLRRMITRQTGKPSPETDGSCPSRQAANSSKIWSSSVGRNRGPESLMSIRSEFTTQDWRSRRSVCSKNRLPARRSQNCS